MGNCSSVQSDFGKVIASSITLMRDHEEIIVYDYVISEYDDSIVGDRVVSRSKQTIELSLSHDDMLFLFKAYARFHSFHHKVYQSLLKSGTRKQKQDFLMQTLREVRKYYCVSINPRDMNDFRRNPCRVDGSFDGSFVVNGYHSCRMVSITPSIAVIDKDIRFNVVLEAL